MDDYDDLQVEEVSYFDFVEEMNENLADDDEIKDKKKSFNFDSYLNSNIDYWLWTLLHLTLVVMLLPFLVWLVLHLLLLF